MHASISLKDKVITPEYKNYAVWICLAFASLDLFIYQIIQIIFDFKNKKDNKINKISKQLNTTKNSIKKSDIKILMTIYNEGSVDINFLKQQLNFNEKDFRKLITSEYIKYNNQTNQYSLNKQLKFAFID